MSVSFFCFAYFSLHSVKFFSLIIRVFWLVPTQTNHVSISLFFSLMKEKQMWLVRTQNK
jgi:hypothetical protein